MMMMIILLQDFGIKQLDDNDDEYSFTRLWNYMMMMTILLQDFRIK